MQDNTGYIVEGDPRMFLNRNGLWEKLDEASEGYVHTLEELINIAEDLVTTASRVFPAEYSNGETTIIAAPISFPEFVSTILMATESEG
jgi:hypothetical protein